MAGRPEIADFSADSFMVFTVVFKITSTQVTRRFFHYKCRSAKDNFKKRGHYGILANV